MQNKHQEHFEDTILTGDLSALHFFETDYEVSLKIDGSPSIVFGTNPTNGKFFVCTKSAFNKVKKLKINYAVKALSNISVLKLFNSILFISSMNNFFLINSIS